jgi:DNA-binding transcriptional ArsR family regulator
MDKTKGKRKNTPRKASHEASELTDAHLSEIAQFFGVLSESSRLRLLRALMEGPLNVSELMQAAGMKQGNVSKHLGVLLAAGFVAREQEGTFARYSIADQTVFTLCAMMCVRVEERARERLQKLG